MQFGALEYASHAKESCLTVSAAVMHSPYYCEPFKCPNLHSGESDQP